MNSTKECYEALLRGEKLRPAFPLSGSKKYVALDLNGNLVFDDYASAHFGFDYPENWEIYHEPRCGDALEDWPALCWVDGYSGDARDLIEIIESGSEGDYVSSRGTHWEYATLVTREEFEKYNGRLFPVTENEEK